MQAAELLVSLHAQRTLMVVDPFFAMANFVREIRGSLAEKAIASELFTDFQPDPTDQNVLAGAACFSMFAADSNASASRSHTSQISCWGETSLTRKLTSVS